MRSADAGTGQHGNDSLRDHGQVDADRFTLVHPKRLEGVGGLGNTFEKIGVGDIETIPFRLPHPVNGHLVPAPRFHVAVHTIHTGVQGSISEPASEGALPLEHLGEGRRPLEGARLLGPEGFWVGLSSGHQFGGGRRLGHKFWRRRETPRFVKHRLKGFGVLCHQNSLVTYLAEVPPGSR